MSRKERQGLLIKKKEKREVKEKQLKRRWTKNDAKAMASLFDEVKEILNLK